MRILINNLRMPVGSKIEDILAAAQDVARQNSVYAENLGIYRYSIDARHKRDVRYVCSVSADAPEGTNLSGAKDISPLPEGEIEIKPISNRRLKPVVVGMGPCGLFCAYVLALRGCPPLIAERGEPVESRRESVKRFWETGELSENSNVQFGEGGAGTFSDGKLNTGNRDRRQRFILETFVKFGAPKDILYTAKPHIGTDELGSVLRNMRKELLNLGCEIRFRTALTAIGTKDGKMAEIELNHGESIPCDTVFLAIGHSSRDTYQMLNEAGVTMEQKPFAAGVRIEHKQSFIDGARYGDFRRELPPADYKLVYNGKDRSCYSFCMCPGGVVVNASSEPGRLALNGMSNHKRDGENADSALVVTVRPKDFEGTSPLAGVEFQRKYEESAFKLGGGDYSAPAELARDFARGKFGGELGNVAPSYTGETVPADLRRCLPGFISKTLSEGLRYFETKIPGFTEGDGVLLGIESRTSAPLRIVRGSDFQSTSLRGLYPLGEGAGYAGGIMSAALDGIKAALSLK